MKRWLRVWQVVMLAAIFALWQLLSQPEEGRAMGARGRKRIEQELSLDRMADGHGALYRRVLGRAPYVGDQAALRPA